MISLKSEIVTEIKYCFWLIVIVCFGMIWCDIGNREALWESKYASWSYNLDPQEGSGFIDAIVKP